MRGDRVPCLSVMLTGLATFCRADVPNTMRCLGSESSQFGNGMVTIIWWLRARRWGGATVTKIRYQIRSPGTPQQIRIETGEGVVRVLNGVTKLIRPISDRPLTKVVIHDSIARV